MGNKKAISPKNYNIKYIQFKELKALNISENMTSLASQKDEIILMLHLVKKEEEKYIIKKEWIKNNLPFSEDSPSLFIHDSLAIRNDDFLIITLIEEDNIIEKENTPFQIRKLISTGKFLNKIDKIEMDTLISDDDFLGQKVYPIKELYQQQNLNIIFKGRHLFDKYEYELVLIVY